ncbi:hypothetical protein [Comamonas sp. C24C]
MNTNLKLVEVVEDSQEVNRLPANSSTEIKKFEDFPDQCPLEGANPCDGDVYLICTEISSNDPGFKTAKENNKYKKITDPFKICTKHGLSVFSDIESCEHQLNAIPALGTRIASAKLDENDGYIKQTFLNPKHHTWWPYKNDNRHVNFRIVKEVSHVGNQ